MDEASVSASTPGYFTSLLIVAVTLLVVWV